MSAIESYLRPWEAVRRSPEIENAEPITDEAIGELLARWDRIKAWWVFDLMRGCIVRIRKERAERDAAIRWLRRIIDPETGCSDCKQAAAFLDRVAS